MLMVVSLPSNFFLFNVLQSLEAYWVVFYHYLIFFVALGVVYVILKDRKAFPQYSKNILMILSSLFAFLIISLFILSTLTLLAGGHWGGRLICGQDGCTYKSDQPVRDLISDIAVPLIIPYISIIIIGALYLIFTEIPMLKTERRTFDAACILLLGSLLLFLLITGIYTLVYIIFIISMLLLGVIHHYKYFLYIMIILVFLIIIF